jgi:hypothetical protein
VDLNQIFKKNKIKEKQNMLGVGAMHLTYKEKRLDRESSNFFKGWKTSTSLFYI